MIDQVVLKTGNQTVRAQKTFVNDLIVEHNLEINGNNLKFLPALCEYPS